MCQACRIAGVGHWCFLMQPIRTQHPFYLGAAVPCWISRQNKKMNKQF